MEITLSINNRCINKDSQKVGYGWKNYTITLDEFIKKIEKGYAFSGAIIKSEYKSLKKPSKKDVESSEIMALDFDFKDKNGNKDNENYITLDEFIKKPYIKKHALFVYLSPSSTVEHNKYRVVFKLDKKLTQNDFENLVNYFIELYKADISCKNIDRLFYGNNNTYCIKLDGNPINSQKLIELAKRQIKEPPVNYKNNDYKITEEIANEMLRNIPKQQNYYDWLAICYDLVQYFGYNQGVRLINDWSPSKTKTGKVNTEIWAKNIETSYINFPATLYSYAKKYGWEDKNLTPPTKTSTKSLNKKKTDSKDNDSKNNKLNDIYDYLNKLGKFKINRLTNQLELYKNGKISIITDYEINSYWSDMYKKGIYTSVSPQMLHQILSSNFVERYDPIVDYFDSLPEWNKEDQFEILFSCMSISPEIIETCKDYFKKWYVGAIAQALNIGQNHLCLVLHGGQGIGKNTLMRHLTPPPLKSYFEEKNIDPNNPDDRVLTTKMLFIMMDELEGVTKKDMHSLKSIMTQQKFNIRLPYARRHEDYNRRASFCAGVNREEFLNDITGNRRFIVVPIDDNINLTKLEFIDVNQLYAQCYHLLKQGYKYWYDGIEIRELNERNKRFALPSSEEDFIQKYFTPGDKDDNISTFMTPTDILKHIKDQSGEKLYPNIIGKALTNLGYKKVVHKRQYGYFVKIINQNLPNNSYDYKIH